MSLLRDARKTRNWSQSRAIIALEQEASIRKIPIASRTSLKTMLSRWENGKAVDHPYRTLWQWVYGLSADQLDLDGTDGEPTLAIFAAPFSPTIVDPQIPEQFRTILTQFINIDAATGPRTILRSVAAHLESLEELCGIARGGARTELLGIGTRFTEFAGWLYQDAGDTKSAMYWTNRAMDYAQELGDHNLASYVLMRKSNIETGAGHVAQGLGLANASLRSWHDITPGIRILALRQKAYAHALAGERADSVKAIDQARSEVVGLVPGNELDISGYCTAAFVEMEVAHSWARLGDSETAATVYSGSLKVWPDAQHRDRALCTARLARTYASLGDFEKAAELGRSAADMVRRAPSARTLAALRNTAISLAPHRRHESVREFQNAASGLI